MRPLRSWKLTAVSAVLVISGLAACDPPPPPKVLVVNVQGAGVHPDTNPGDGLCQSSYGGRCTLRAALDEAAASHVDRIELEAARWYELDTTMLIDPVAPLLTIVPSGPGGPAWIDHRGGTGPLVEVTGGSVALSRLRLTTEASDRDGLHVASGSTAVLADVEVEVTGDGGVVDGTLVANRSVLHGGAGTGMAIGASGAVTLHASAVHGFGVEGLGVDAGGTATLVSSTVSGNGTGIVADGSVALSLSTVAANHVQATAGGGSLSATGSIVVEAAGAAGCAAPLTSHGWNGLGAGCGTTASDVAIGSTAVGPLSHVTVPYHRLMAGGSALRDLMAIGDGPCTDGTADQRGVDRTPDGTCDAGAYEGPIQVAATAWTVDTAADGPDSEPGDGLCHAATGGCTLRAAMAEAARVSTAGPAPVVSIAAGIDPVLDRALGTMPADRVLLRGDAGGTTTIDAGGTSVPFSHCEGTLRLEDLQVSGATGAAIAARCDELDPLGRIELDRVTLTGNGTGVSGDMFSWDLRLSVHESDISENTGSGIADDFTQVVVSSSRITANGDGGIGLGEHSGSISVSDSTIAGNRFGIGIQYGSITVTRSLIADHDSAAIFTSAGWARVTDSTLSGNGIGVSEGFDGTTTIRRSTLVGNGVGYRSYDAYARLEVAGSVIQGGVACAPGDTPITSLGWNVVSDATCGLTGTGDQQGVDALLGPLADNGGPTLTHLPGPGSPAIDAIPTGTPDLCTGALTDQRGTPRPQGPACDRGAVEQQAPSDPPPTPDP